MDVFKRGKVHNGTLVFAEPLSLPEGPKWLCAYSLLEMATGTQRPTSRRN